MGIEVRLSTQFRMLGPLEVSHDGAPLRLGGERQRALLALLLTQANALVTTERLIEHLSGGEPSQSAANAVHVAVSRLRRVLRCGDEELLVTRPGGYVLSVGPDQLDAARFERLAEQGREAVAAGDPAAAAVRLREALALWRGPALADLALMEFVAPEARRLDELRLLALMERIDADLTLGRHAELIPELEALVAAEPLRERLRQQQMLALYRADRRAEALEVYRDTSALLREELGLEPTRGLQDLEQMVLRQDESLGGARYPRPARARPPGPTGSCARSRGWPRSIPATPSTSAAAGGSCPSWWHGPRRPRWSGSWAPRGSASLRCCARGCCRRSRAARFPAAPDGDRCCCAPGHGPVRSSTARSVAPAWRRPCGGSRPPRGS